METNLEILRIGLQLLDSSVNVCLDDGARAVTCSLLPMEPLQRLEADWARLRAGPRVPVRAVDALLTRQEEAVGRAMTRWLCTEPSLASIYPKLTADADVVAIDTRAPRLQDLPWELLGLGPDGGGSLEAGGERAIVRLLPGPAGYRASASITIGAWSPTPEDPVCAARLAALPRAEEPTLLHVVVHGLSTDQTTFQVGNNRVGPGWLGHRPVPLGPNTSLVVLDSCGGGATVNTSWDSAAVRLLGLGPQAVVAPAHPLSPLAAEAFAGALHAAALSGEPVPKAVARGRAAVGRLARTDPASRWHNLRCYVRDRRWLVRAPRASPLPMGWPRLAAEALPLLARAQEISHRHGFLGVEHLVMACDPAEGSLSARRVQKLLVRCRAGAAAVLSCCDAPGLERQSPRLERIRGRLSDGAGLDELFMALITESASFLDQLAGGGLSSLIEEDATLGSMKLWDPSLPIAAVELACGPRDGERRDWKPGLRLGRHGGDADWLLYEEPGWRDPHLSRNALECRVDGIVLVKSALLCRGESEHPLEPGTHRVFAGDLLHLSPSTWVRLLPRAD